MRVVYLLWGNPMDFPIRNHTQLGHVTRDYMYVGQIRGQILPCAYIIARLDYFGLYFLEVSRSLAIDRLDC